MGDIGEARQKVCEVHNSAGDAAMRGCADSINRYVTLVAAQQTHPDTIKNLLQLPSLPAVGVDGVMHSGLGFGGQALGQSQNKRSASQDHDEDDEEGAPQKRKKKVKKEKDPNAPKRPGSAYIFFQNDIRPEMKAKHPDVQYRDLVSLMATRWSELSNADKEPYQRQANDAMRQWRIDDATYRGVEPPGNSPTLGHEGIADNSMFEQSSIPIDGENEASSPVVNY